MLIFSALLDINPTLTEDKFIELAISWNQNSPHEDNIISDLVWDGSRNVKYGRDGLSLEIIEYRDENVIAIRYERVGDDGIVWDSDFVMNFKEMRMAVQLDRSFREDALVIDSDFSTPHFIRLLIDNGYIRDDALLRVSGKPLVITEKNLGLLADVINGQCDLKLPVVYVSKTFDDTDPIDVWKMAGRLKGVAHLFVESSRNLNNKLRSLCSDKNDYYGAIGVYYPNSIQPPQRYRYHGDSEYDPILYQRVLRDVIRYSTVQRLDELYTWDGVSKAVISKRYFAQRDKRMAAETEMKKAQNEIDDVYSAFDSELDELQRQVEMLQKSNEALMCENYGLRAKLTELNRQPLFYFGEERELYAGEIKDMLCEVIEKALTTASVPNTRRHDVYKDILVNNRTNECVSEKRDRIKQLLKTYDGMTKTMRQELVDFGFSITEDGKHYKLVFGGDNRYATCLSKTPSDHREGKNAASEIVGKMF